MNEKHLQDCQHLVEKLLNCPSGLEQGILQSQAELVKPELLETISQTAQKLQAQRNYNAAYWLNDLFFQLAGSIAGNLPLTVRPKSHVEDKIQFITETFQVITANLGYANAVYQFLIANQAFLNADLLIALPIAGTQFLLRSQNQEYAAGVIATFGNLLAQFPGCDQDLRLELAILAYQQALQVYTHDSFPVEWAITQSNLGNAYSDRVKGDRTENLRLAIDAYQRSLTVLTSHNSFITWGKTQIALANAYISFTGGERAENLELAIKAFQDALQVYTLEQFPVEWAMTQNNLGGAYTERIRGNRAENLELAITAYQQSLRGISLDTSPADGAMIQYALGNVYSERIEGDRAENLELAITAHRNAFQGYTLENFPVYWAWVQSKLGDEYKNRIRGDRAENLESAIAAYQNCLQIFTPEYFPTEWAMTQKNLGGAYTARIQGDTAKNLELAIDAYQQALQVYTCETNPVTWASIQCNLGVVYNERLRGSRVENQELAINACKNALQIFNRESFPIEWADTQNVLGNCYDDRILGDLAENRELAIAAYQQSLTVRTRENSPRYWAEVQLNLGDVYTERIQGDRAENLELAINACQQALQVLTEKDFPIEWAKAQRNLGNAYGDRIRGDRAENLELAIACHQNTLQIYTRTNHPVEWAKTQHNLGYTYGERIRGNRSENIELAINACQQALQVFTHEYFPFAWARVHLHLGNAYRRRIKGDRAENLESAIVSYQLTLRIYNRKDFPVNWARVQNNLGSAYLERKRGEPADNLANAINAYQEALEVFKPEQLPNDCRRTAKLLGNLLADEHRYAEAITSYKAGLQAVEILYRSCLFRSNQDFELTETDDLYRRAAHAFAHVGDLQTAVVTVERGRAKGLSESLERDRANLSQVEKSAPAVFASYQQAVANLRQLEIQERAMNSTLSHSQFSLDALHQRASQLHEDLNTAIAAIRAIPGYEDFLFEPDFTDISAAVYPDQPLVYLVTTATGSLALIVYSSDEPEHPEMVVDSIWLNSLTDETLLTLLVGPADIPEQGGWFGAYNHRRSNQDTWFQTLDQVTQQLWDSLMESVLTHLTNLGVWKAVLIPTGFLGLLPLHAAWTDDPSTPTGRRYALDVITFTYAPNARSLVAAREIRDRTVPTSLLAIDNPQPTQCTYLSNSEQEVQAAISHFPNHKVLPKEQATRDDVLAALSKYPVLHFSCHGYANLASPLDSGLLMSNDQLLTLRDFFSLDFLNLQDESHGIRIAILSACETGLPGMELPDEVINLPTGLLQAGVGGIVSSLWSVADLSTMIMLTRFYDLWCNDNLEPAIALRQAQLWIRDTTSQQKAKYFQETNPDLFQALILLEPDYFAHPFHWAAFTYVGV